MSERLAAWGALLVVAGCFSESNSDTSGGPDGGSEVDTSASTATTASESGSGEVTGVPTASDPTIEPTTETSSAPTTGPTTDPTDSTTEASPCGPNETFIAPVPPGWNPEIYFLVLGPAPGQPDACPDALQENGVVLEKPESTACTCDCDPACWIDVWSESSCGDLIDFAEVRGDMCTPLVPLIGMPPPVHVTISPNELAQQGGCNAPRAVGDITADGHHRVCQHVAGNDCVPTPAPPVIGPCVSIDGWAPQECPEGPYTELRRTADDATAACEACPSCIDQAVDACFDATGQLHTDNGCMDEGNFQDAMCSPIAGRSIRLSLDLVCPDAVAGPPELDGPRTFCCMP